MIDCNEREKSAKKTILTVLICSDQYSNWLLIDCNNYFIFFNTLDSSYFNLQSTSLRQCVPYSDQIPTEQDNKLYSICIFCKSETRPNVKFHIFLRFCQLLSNICFVRKSNALLPNIKSIVI